MWLLPWPVLVALSVLARRWRRLVVKWRRVWAALWPLGLDFRWQALALVPGHPVLCVKTAAARHPRWRQEWPGLWLHPWCPLLLELLPVVCCAVAKLGGRPWPTPWRRSRPLAHRPRWGRRLVGGLLALRNRCLPKYRAALAS